MRLLIDLFRFFERPRAHAWVIFAALLLVTPALFSPLVIDDLIQQVKLRPDRSYAGFDETRYGLFSFADGSAAQRAALMEEGVASWWTDQNFKLSFWRPLASATHRLDFRLWGDHALLIHAHSLLWFVLLLVALSRLYQRFHPPKIAVMALALYAFDDARGFVLSVACNRNALMTAVFGVGVLIAHDRWRRDGWRWGAWLGPALLGVGLLCGESAIATMAYLLAYSLSLDTGALRARLARLLPFIVVVLLWQGVYGHLGYGTAGSGAYVHPVSEPLRFVTTFFERAPALAAAQVAFPPSEFWFLWPPSVAWAFYLLALLILATVGRLLWPLLLEDRVARFWVLGAVLALVPVTAVFTMDRLLVFVGIGASGALARLFARSLETPFVGGSRLLLGGLVAVHLVIAPLALPFASGVAIGMDAALAEIDDSIPREPSVAKKSLVVLRVPADGAVGYVSTNRAARGEPRPRSLRMLAMGDDEIRVTRLDERSLRMRTATGFYQHRPAAMVRSPVTPSFVGESISLSNMTVTVTRVNEDGVPLEADFRFDRELESPELLWTRWHRLRLVPWTPPPVGATVQLPSLF